MNELSNAVVWINSIYTTLLNRLENYRLSNPLEYNDLEVEIYDYQFSGSLNIYYKSFKFNISRWTNNITLHLRQDIIYPEVTYHLKLDQLLKSVVVFESPHKIEKVPPSIILKLIDKIFSLRYVVTFDNQYFTMGRIQQT